MSQAEFPFPSHLAERHPPQRVNQPRGLIRRSWNVEQPRRPQDTYGRDLTPGPYGVGPIIDLPRESYWRLENSDRISAETVRIWEKLG